MPMTDSTSSSAPTSEALRTVHEITERLSLNTICPPLAPVVARLSDVHPLKAIRAF
jgi:hypothetical protein